MASGLMSRQEYEERLHELFLAHPEDELLLELEIISSDIKSSSARLMELEGSIQSALSEILPRLEAAYRENRLSFPDFCALAYALCRKLPHWLEDEEPFCTLADVGDYAEICTEARLREISEQCFRYAEPNHPPVERIMETSPQPPRVSWLKRLFRRKK
jgi:hypothetical protein